MFLRYEMKKLLATSAIALVALSGAASAQSVLERVLGQIDNATNLASVNGTFANIAENIGGSEVIYVDANGASLSQAEYDQLAGQDVQTDYTAYTPTANTVYYNSLTGELITATEYGALGNDAQGNYVSAETAGLYTDGNGNIISTPEYTALYATQALLDAELLTYNPVVAGVGDGINGRSTTLLMVLMPRRRKQLLQRLFLQQSGTCLQSTWVTWRPQHLVR